MADVHRLASAESRVYLNSARSLRSVKKVEWTITIKKLQPFKTVTFSIVMTRKDIAVKKVPAAKKMTTAKKKTTARKVNLS